MIDCNSIDDDNCVRICPANPNHKFHKSKIFSHVRKCKQLANAKLFYCKKDISIIFLGENMFHHYEICSYCNIKSQNSYSNISKTQSISVPNNTINLDLNPSDTFNSDQSFIDDIKSFIIISDNEMNSKPCQNNTILY